MENSVAIFKWLHSKWLQKLFVMCGFHWFETFAKYSVNALIIIAIIVSVLLADFYTIICYYNDLEILLKCLCIIGIIFQILARYVTFLKYPNLVTQNIQFMQLVHEANIQNKTNKLLLLKYIKIAVIVFKLSAGNYVVTATSFVTFPIIYYCTNGSKEIILPIILPFLTTSNSYHYVLITIYHVIAVCIACFQTVASDAFFFSQIIHAYAFSKIFENNFNILNKMIIDKKHSELEVKLCLRNILLLHQEFSAFMQRLSTSEFTMCLFQICMNSISVGVIIFTFFMIDWFPVYFFFTVQFFQLFVFCVLGTIIEIMNDNIITIIYNSNWYLLPIAEQKTILILFLKAQHPVTLTVGGIVPMNVDTMISIMKKIYTFTVMLFQFVD